MIDIIITTYNRNGFFAKCWCSFVDNTDFSKIGKIIISDDGSTDGTETLVRSVEFNNAQVELVPDNRRRLGLIPRFNMALELCTADIICEFQDDVEFYPGWLDDQLKMIDKADFITGYDGAEHASFDEVNGYKIKHSSGFVQLMARRSTWDKWFPMQSRHDFPTPTVIDGRPVGSGIDTRIYNARKNDPKGEVKYLVIPGLIHKAHHFNSTWRPDIAAKRQRFALNKPGGLTPDNVHDYWQKRYAKQQERAVGFAGRPTDEQDKILAEKRQFITPWIDPSKLTIDYGCGVGKMTSLFKGPYLGLDVTPSFLEIARRENPGIAYRPIKSVFEPFTETQDFLAFEQFFTCNVLQHNHDAIVSYVFRNLASIKPQGFDIVLYENTHKAASKNHMRFRTPMEYHDFIAEHFTIKVWGWHSHVVHGEEHSVIRVQV